MMRILKQWRGCWHRQCGITSIEYALIALLIAVAILGVVSALGISVFDLWTEVANCVNDPGSCT